MIPGLAPSVGIVTAGVLAVTLIPMAVNGYNGMIEEKAVARIEASLSKQAREYESTMAANALSAQQTSEGLREGFRQKEAEYLERLDVQEDFIEQELRIDAFSAGNTVWREYYRVLCEISKTGGDIGAIQACDIHTSEADFSQRSPILGINKEVIERWYNECEDQERCDYGVIALRVGPAFDLLRHLEKIGTAARIQDANFDTVVDQIQQIIDMPGPEIDNSNN